MFYLFYSFFIPLSFCCAPPSPEGRKCTLKEYSLVLCPARPKNQRNAEKKNDLHEVVCPVSLYFDLLGQNTNNILSCRVTSNGHTTKGKAKLRKENKKEFFSFLFFHKKKVIMGKTTESN